MNREIKKQWVEALRSGEYKQGHCYLRRVNNEYCCLGVLCNLVASEQWVQEEHGFSLYKCLHALPQPVQVITGISDLGGVGTYPKNLADLNDKGVSFLEIADIIEKHFKTKK